MWQGFAERKALLLLEVIQRCRDRRAEVQLQMKARASPLNLVNTCTSMSPIRAVGLSLRAPVSQGCWLFYDFII